MAKDKADIAVSAESLCKTYQIGEAEVEVLKNVNLNVAAGEFVTICGPSGAGKTTLLNIISGIDQPTSGRIVVFGEDLTDKNEDFLAEFRCTISALSFKRTIWFLL